jgi:molybdopterin-containing oxidoreductase family membrane subunit
MSFIETEKNWYPEGVERCSLGKFAGWLGGLGVVALIGFIAMIVCFAYGLVSPASTTTSGSACGSPLTWP